MQNYSLLSRIELIFNMRFLVCFCVFMNCVYLIYVNGREQKGAEKTPIQIKTHKGVTIKRRGGTKKGNINKIRTNKMHQIITCEVMLVTGKNWGKKKESRASFLYKIKRVYENLWLKVIGLLKGFYTAKRRKKRQANGRENVNIFEINLRRW